MDENRAINDCPISISSVYSTLEYSLEVPLDRKPLRNQRGDDEVQDRRAPCKGFGRSCRIGRACPCIP